MAPLHLQHQQQRHQQEEEEQQHYHPGVGGASNSCSVSNATPAAAGHHMQFAGMTPGSVYSTPTLTLGKGAAGVGGRSQVGNGGLDICCQAG